MRIFLSILLSSLFLALQGYSQDTNKTDAEGHLLKMAELADQRYADWKEQGGLSGVKSASFDLKGLRKLRKDLGSAQTAILAFYPLGNEYAGFSIHANGTRFIDFNDQPGLRMQVESFLFDLHQPVPRPESQWFAAKSKLVYDGLMKPLLKDLPGGTENLIIIPTGELVFIPFAGLSSVDPVNQDGPAYRLSDAFSISYLPSLSALVQPSIKSESGETLYWGEAKGAYWEGFNSVFSKANSVLGSQTPNGKIVQSSLAFQSILTAKSVDLNTYCLVNEKGIELNLQDPEDYNLVWQIRYALESHARSIMVKIRPSEMEKDVPLLAEFYHQLKGGETLPKSLRSAQELQKGVRVAEWATWEIWGGVSPIMQPPVWKSWTFLLAILILLVSVPMIIWAWKRTRS